MEGLSKSTTHLKRIDLPCEREMAIAELLLISPTAETAGERQEESVLWYVDLKKVVCGF